MLQREPILPKAAAGDAETDLYSTAVSAKDIMQGEPEEGTPLDDEFLALGTLLLASGNSNQILDVRDLDKKV